jgi:hypothetical protein
VQQSHNQPEYLDRQQNQLFSSNSPVTPPDITEVDPISLISPEPQIFTFEDNIVMILKPKEFYR